MLHSLNFGDSHKNVSAESSMMLLYALGLSLIHISYLNSSSASAKAGNEPPSRRGRIYLVTFAVPVSYTHLKGGYGYEVRCHNGSIRFLRKGGSSCAKEQWRDPFGSSASFG